MAAVFMLTAEFYVTASKLVFPRSNTATTGIVIREIATGKDLVSENADKFMTPASILKCVTAASTVLADATSQHFSTDIFIDGKIESDSVLVGNIVIKGSGDPTTESDNFPDNRGLADSIASRLNRMGLTEILGRVVVDTLGMPEQGPGYGWEYSDLKHSYGAGLYVFNYKDNSIGSRAVMNPAARFQNDLCSSLASRQIRVSNRFVVQEDDDQDRVVYEHNSPDKKEILRVMMEQSHNLYAEGMLRALAPGHSVEDALQREVDLLSGLGIDLTCLNASDGSGLSRHNAVTPGFMADMLTQMALGDDAMTYVSLFPKAGIEGTVKRFLNDTCLEGKLVLKSGSMRGVQTFAGYRLDDSGKPTHVVVIMVNQFTCKRDAVRRAMTAFLLDCFPE